MSPNLHRLLRKQSLADGASAKFTYVGLDGIEREGLVIQFAGELRAYENRCRHVPITLDYGDNQFFTRDEKFLICQSHGATYDPLTGLCVRGPCVGLNLFPLSIEVADEWICLHLPDQKKSG